jgi:hypothetical protein
MNLERSEISFERKPMSGIIQQRGNVTGFPPVFAFLFGGIFVAVGFCIGLIGLKILPVDPKTVHAPYWTLTVAGSVFAVAGALVMWGFGWRQWRARKRSQEAARIHPDEIAFQDYDWDPRGFTPARWKPAIQAIAGASFLSVFLSIFNWWAFFTRSDVIVKIIVSVFDFFLLLFIYQAVLRVGRAMKFAGSQIQFPEFPCRKTGPVKLLWKSPAGSFHANKGQFTLRCVEEFWVTIRSGRNRRRQIVHEEIWSQTRFLDEPHWFSRGEEVELQFDLVSDLPSTNLRAARAVFWELKVKLEMPGLDFEECYLVPVYETKGDVGALAVGQ